MVEQNYYSIGKKYGIAFKDEVIENIQTKLEKQVSAYICRISKKTAPLEATLMVLQSKSQRKDSLIPEDGDKYEKIIYARAEANKRKSDKIRQKTVADALQTHKTYMASLEAFVKKKERKSDWQYQRFLLGAAKNSGIPNHPVWVRFTSQVHLDYKEKNRKEIDDHED